VVNNAGAGHLGTIDVEPASAVGDVMEVSFFGVVMVTKEVLPHLRFSGGRLAAATSVGGVVGQPFNQACCAARFAVEGFMESLAPVAATVGARVSVVEPGAVSSEFVANAGIDLDAAFEEAGPYEPALRGYLHRVMAQFASAQTSDGAAASIITLLTVSEPPFRVQTSAWAEAFVGTRLVYLDGSAVIGTGGNWIGGDG
jgi:NAD(P)-dependent dehydrogenase (short-subunit alcohol dehydrogenase family)